MAKHLESVLDLLVDELVKCNGPPSHFHFTRAIHITSVRYHSFYCTKELVMCYRLEYLSLYITSSCHLSL